MTPRAREENATTGTQAPGDERSREEPAAATRPERSEERSRGSTRAQRAVGTRVRPGGINQ
jgi:hypothetical protein